MASTSTSVETQPIDGSTVPQPTVDGPTGEATAAGAQLSPQHQPAHNVAHAAAIPQITTGMVIIGDHPDARFNQETEMPTAQNTEESSVGGTSEDEDGAHNVHNSHIRPQSTAGNGTSMEVPMAQRPHPRKAQSTNRYAKLTADLHNLRSSTEWTREAVEQKRTEYVAKMKALVTNFRRAIDGCDWDQHRVEYDTRAGSQVLQQQVEHANQEVNNEVRFLEGLLAHITTHSAEWKAWIDGLPQDVAAYEKDKWHRYNEGKDDQSAKNCPQVLKRAKSSANKARSHNISVWQRCEDDIDQAIEEERTAAENELDIGGSTAASSQVHTPSPTGDDLLEQPRRSPTTSTRAAPTPHLDAEIQQTLDTADEVFGVHTVVQSTGTAQSTFTATGPPPRNDTAHRDPFAEFDAARSNPVPTKQPQPTLNYTAQLPPRQQTSFFGSAPLFNDRESTFRQVHFGDNGDNRFSRARSPSGTLAGGFTQRSSNRHGETQSTRDRSTSANRSTQPPTSTSSPDQMTQMASLMQTMMQTMMKTMLEVNQANMAQMLQVIKQAPAAAVVGSTAAPTATPSPQQITATSTVVPTTMSPSPQQATASFTAPKSAMSTNVDVTTSRLRQAYKTPTPASDNAQAAHGNSQPPFPDEFPDNDEDFGGTQTATRNSIYGGAQRSRPQRSAFPQPRGNFASSANATGPSTTPRELNSPSIRPPEPRPFNGEYHDWPRFTREWDNYEEHVPQDPVSKMSLLKRLLKGPAATTAQRFDGDVAEEYDELWDALTARFHKPELVVQHFHTQLWELRAPTRDNIHELRVYHGDLCKAVNKLKRADHNVDNFENSMVVTKRLKASTYKLKAHIKECQIKASEEGRQWNTTAALAALEQYIVRMEMDDAEEPTFDTQRTNVKRRAFLNLDGSRVEVDCADEEVHPVEDTAVTIPQSSTFCATSPQFSAVPQSYGSPQVPTAENVAKLSSEYVHINYGEHQKKPFGRRSTAPHFGPAPQPKRFNQQARQPPNKRAYRECCMCHVNTHRTQDCTKYRTFFEREQQMRATNTCSFCLRAGHLNERCRSYLRVRHNIEACKRRVCPECKELHHVAVCPVKYPDPTAPSRASPQGFKSTTPQGLKSTTPQGFKPTTPHGFKPSSVPQLKSKQTHMSRTWANSLPPSDEAAQDEPYYSQSESDDSDYPEEGEYPEVDDRPVFQFQFGTYAANRLSTGSPSTQTLLMTTRLPVHNPEDSNLTSIVPIFFDSGSSQTYITKELAKKLQLRIKRQFTTSIHTFLDEHGDAGRQITVWAVEFDVHMSDGSTLRIEADAIDEFAAPMPTVKGGSEQVAYILANQNLPVPIVADTPQILIGSDHINDFDFVRRRKRLVNGFYVYDTKVGPILSGKGKVTGAVHSQQAKFVFRAVTKLDTLRPVAHNFSTLIKPTQLLAETEKLWRLEAIGISSAETLDNDAIVLQRHRQTLVQLPDGRYETGLPWLSFIHDAQMNGKEVGLSTNYRPALARLNSIWRQYSKSPQILSTIHSTFMEQLNSGIIELAPSDETEAHLRHFLPHHPVFRADKPTKIRIVFDGSCKEGPHAKSLNDCLHTGPNMLESIIGMLLRCRIPVIIIIGDIEKAFHQIALRLEDRGVVNFLWLKDPSQPPTGDNLAIFRFCRVPFGLNASPFLLLATVDAHLNAHTDPVAREIRRNIYSDNVFIHAHTVAEGLQKQQSSKMIFTEANMNIREFISNSPEVQQGIPEADRAKATKEATLGLDWDSQSDIWTISLPDPDPVQLKESPQKSTKPSTLVGPQGVKTHGNQSTIVALNRRVLQAKHVTQRVVISVIHSLWDPFSVLCPITLKARLLLQRITHSSKGFDLPLDDATVQEWWDATSDWKGQTFHIPRQVLPTWKPTAIQHHCFVDASKIAYAAAHYLRFSDDDGRVHIQLILAKSRVKTIKPVLTIPRMELMAALIGCRLTEYLRKEMFPDLCRYTGVKSISTYLWGDNHGVLYWIRDSTHSYGAFVQNRLDEIRRVENVEFRYINTKENPADIASRGSTADELRTHKLWWSGPEFLQSTPSTWPAQPANFQPFQEEQLGIDAKKTVSIEQESTFVLHKLPHIDLLGMVRAVIPRREQSFDHIRRVSTYVIRFVHILLHKQGRAFHIPHLERAFDKSHSHSMYGTELILVNGSEERTLHLPSTAEYSAAEKQLVWSAQNVTPPTARHVEQFQIFRADDGLLRCHGRLHNSDFPMDTRTPIWLPPQSPVVGLIVTELHTINAHAPVTTTLSLLRKRYWVPKGRRVITSVLRIRCMGCRMARGPSFHRPPFANLPTERINPGRPFANIGLDLFGPYVVFIGSKPPEPTPSGRRTKRPKITHNLPQHIKKVWGVIFTCMSTRAVHLEVCHSQSAEDLLLAFDAFISRRGHPDSVTSDNAPSIMLVNKTLKKMWQEALEAPSTRDYCRKHGLECNYITPEAPWQGGFYEKLVHTVKRSFNTAIGRRHLSLPHFTQLLTRVEHTVNCRPLTMPSEADVWDSPIRPIDFLQPLANVSAMGPLPHDEDEDYHPRRLTSEQQLHQTFRQMQSTLEKFWERWRMEYLLSLRETSRKVHNNSTVARLPTVGEFVFVDDDEMMPRPFWKIARVTELIPGRDGTIRSVQLKFPGGFVTSRAINRLYPLELSPSNGPSTNPLDTTEHKESELSTSSS